MSRINWAPLKNIIERHESFLITTHVRPDADALGSQRGLASLLESFGKEVTMVNATAPPANLNFMNTDGEVKKLGNDVRKDEVPDVDVQIVVDTSAWQQLGAIRDVIRNSDCPRVVIDHHVSSDDLGATEFKDVASAATGELICEAAEYLGVTFDVVRSNCHGYGMVSFSVNDITNDADLCYIDGTGRSAGCDLQSHP